MSQTIVVTYDVGVLRPETPLDLEPAKRYVATLVPIDDADAPTSAWDVLAAIRGLWKGRPIGPSSTITSCMGPRSERPGKASERHFALPGYTVRAGAA